MKISLCLITWNELRGCEIDVPKIDLSQFDEVYAVDGGSSDGTVDFLESFNIPVYKQPKKGLNAAYIHAFEKSEADAVVIYFPKGTVPVEDLYLIKEELKKGTDLVVLSRMIKGAVNEEDSNILRPRKWAVLCLSMVAGLVWKREGYRIRDVLHGIKGVSVEAFNNMKILDYGLSIDIETVIRSYKLKQSRIEIPTIETARTYGESHFKFWKTGVQLLKYLWFELFRKG